MSDESGRVVPLDETIDATLGISYESQEIGHVKGTMPVENRVRQPFGIVHGGAYAVMAESLASLGTFQGVHEDGMIALGMSNQTQLMRPIASGTVHADAKVIHRGGSHWVWDVDLTDDDGNRCAASRVVVAVRPRRN